nr:phage integrase family protein [Burkholderia ambifaria]
MLPLSRPPRQGCRDAQLARDVVRRRGAQEAGFCNRPAAGDPAGRPAALAATPAADAPAHAAPSLEDFAAEHDPDGFYTEKELLDLFAARYAGANADAGATLRRQQHNARLRARQMAALDALARLVVEDPRPEHHVLGWFDTAVALRLADVGPTTIGKLVETINAVGYRWYRRVPRLGEIGARRITACLAHYGDVAGLQLAAGRTGPPVRAHAARPAACGSRPGHCDRAARALLAATRAGRLARCAPQSGQEQQPREQRPRGDRFLAR